MTYLEAVEYLASLAPRGWRLGLDRMDEFLRLSDLASYVTQPKFVHVAGTNGKGSVTEFVQSLLIAHGFRTGGFFSPYVYDLRERVQFNHELISEDDFAALATYLRPIGDSLEGTKFGGPTEFEFKTALGFAYWKQQEVDYVSLEVGLGGRLDATNVVTPAVSAIVSIGLDHTSILGDTLGQIAFEKAGVIKPGKPVAVGRLAQEAMSVVEAQATENGSPLYRWGTEFHSVWSGDGLTVMTPSKTYERLKPGLYGDIQGQNAAIAIMALQAAGIDLDREAVEMGIASARIPGRFEVRTVGSKTVVLDGAHNLEAMTEFVSAFKARFPGKRATVITNMVQGHSYERLYGPLLEIMSSALVPPINFSRAFDGAEIAAHLGQFTRAETTSSVVEALDRVLAGDQNLAIVTGSFYLVGEVGNALNAR